jgi:hypothetical protein
VLIRVGFWETTTCFVKFRNRNKGGGLASRITQRATRRVLVSAGMNLHSRDKGRRGASGLGIKKAMAFSAAAFSAAAFCAAAFSAANPNRQNSLAKAARKTSTRR